MTCRRILALLLVLGLAAGCGAGGQAGEEGGAAAGEDLTVEVVASGLAGPTQITIGPDGRLWIAQLAGGENAGLGQVLAVDLESGEREVLLEGLDKPTGLAVLDDHLWVALPRSLVRAPLAADGRPGAVEVVLDGLANNGRSNGTLTVTPEARLLYETSGSRDGRRAAEGSGILWELDPAQPQQTRPYATGLKNAYAHAIDGQGRRWSTEIGDGSYDGEPPPDELNLLGAGTDHGWPQCIGDRTPVAEFGGTAASCAATAVPLAVFPPGATPTGLAVAPWDPDVLLVALWTRGEVVAVPTAGAGAGPVEPEVVLSGLDGPQHLLALPDGDLLLSEHGSGRILRVQST